MGEILPGAMQPRTGFDDESLNELAESIRENGIMQPLVVRPREGGYELIAGERRWRASQMAGLAKVPVIVRNVDDQTALELALIENLQREDLDPIEESKGYAQLMDQFDLTQEEVATRVGKNRATVANALRLAKLPAEVQAYVRDGMLSSGHAKAILGLKDAGDQVAAAKRVIKKELSVRATEDLVSELGQADYTKAKRGKAKSAAGEAHIQNLEAKLQERLKDAPPGEKMKDPDPERWIPRRERASFLRKQRRGKFGSAAQGTGHAGEKDAIKAEIAAERFEWERQRDPTNFK